MNLKIVRFLIIYFITQNNFAQYTDLINSNRPGESMAAYSVGKTIIQVESGLNYLSTKHDLLEYETKGINLDLVARYGFFIEELELLGGINLQKDTYKDYFNPYNTIEEQRTGIKSVTFGLKYLLYDPFKNYKEKINYTVGKPITGLNGANLFRQYRCMQVQISI